MSTYFDRSPYQGEIQIFLRKWKNHSEFSFPRIGWFGLVVWVGGGFPFTPYKN